MIFALLAKVVAVYVRFTIVYIRHLSLEGSFALLWRLARSLVRLQVSFHESFEQFIIRGRSESWSPKDGRGMSGSMAAFIGSSWWTSYKLIFIVWRRVTARTATRA